MVPNEKKSVRKTIKEDCAKVEAPRLELAGVIYCNSADGVEKTTVDPPRDHGTYHGSGYTFHVFHSAGSFITGTIVEC